MNENTNKPLLEELNKILIEFDIQHKDITIIISPVFQSHNFSLEVRSAGEYSQSITVFNTSKITPYDIISQCQTAYCHHTDLKSTVGLLALRYFKIMDTHGTIMKPHVYCATKDIIKQIGDINNDNEYYQLRQLFRPIRHIEIKPQVVPTLYI